MPTPPTWKIQRLRASRTEGGLRRSRPSLRVPLPSSALTAAILAVVLIGASVLAWQVWPRDPGSGSAEAGFLRDMSSHHAQAVQMALVIRDRTQDPQLKALATDIALTQTNEMGWTRGLLDAWGLPLTSNQLPMTWMGDPTDGLMPGMATADQVGQLSTLPVDEADVLFLQLMIRHHQGGVDMAKAILARSDQKQVTFFANRVVMLQNAEIDTMNQMLEQRGQSPITDPLPASHDHS